MDHAKYHAIRSAAVSAYNGGDVTALAAVVESRDQLYNSTDWSAWGDAENLVFGILTGLKLAHPDSKLPVVAKSREAALCLMIIGDKDAFHEIAKLVWHDSI